MLASHRRWILAFCLPLEFREDAQACPVAYLVVLEMDCGQDFRLSYTFNDRLYTFVTDEHSTDV